MKIIGLTGGMGSGKSTVSRILQKQGAVIIDADHIAASVTEKGHRALEELASCFGRDILTADGRLDRKKMADIAFKDREKLALLNSIIHKYVTSHMQSEIDQLKKQDGSSLVVLDVPIPVEHGFLDLVDTVWVVTADREARIERVMERSGFAREDVLNRISSQMSDNEYISLADKVIYNNGSLYELEKDVLSLLNLLDQGGSIV